MDHSVEEKFQPFQPKSKYDSFNSKYSKIHFLYTHFEHFLLATLSLFMLKSGPHVWQRKKVPPKMEYLMDDIKLAGNEPTPRCIQKGYAGFKQKNW